MSAGTVLFLTIAVIVAIGIIVALVLEVRPMRGQVDDRDRRFDEAMDRLEKTRRILMRDRQEYLAAQTAYEIIRDTMFEDPDHLSDMITVLHQRGDAISMRVVDQLAEFLFQNPSLRERFLVE